MLEGDVRKEAKKIGKFDRIIMPLPKNAGSFLDTALPVLNIGGMIHFYDFSHNCEESIKKVKEISEKLGYIIDIINAIVIVKKN